MSPNDESFLSAYIDGELGPDEQRAVESALASDAHLAETVQGLLRARARVAELSRPLPPDLSSQVMRRIHERANPARPWRSARRWVHWTAGGIAVAISLLLISPYLRHHAVPAPGPTPTRYDSTSHEQNSSKLASIDSPKASLSESDAADRRASVGFQSGSSHSVSATRSGDAVDATYQVRVGALLKDKNLQRVFLVTDRVGEPAEQQVISLVERSTHHDYYKITVSQGIVIDPRHPGKATVFAVVLDRSELDPFRQRLKDAFKDRLEDNEINPAVAMQLVDIGQVVSLPAHPISDVTIPSSTMALRARARGVPDADLTSLPPPDPELARPTPEQERSSPAAELAQDSQNQARDPGTVTNAAPAVESSSGGRGSSQLANPHPTRLATSSRGSGQGHDGGPSVPAARGQTEEARDMDHHLMVLVWISGPGSG